MAVNKIPDGTRMVVVKCPTYYPGDIRILYQKNIPELSHLTDVVVFSTDESAKRPVPHEIHESDLDGDEYFVCWDQDLVPEKEMAPMAPTKREKVCQMPVRNPLSIFEIDTYERSWRFQVAFVLHIDTDMNLR